MLGRGEPVKAQFMGTGVLLVNEIFETIQGEAYYTGAPAVFIRLQGCDVGCPWCDTKHTWRRHAGDLVTIRDMLAKTGDAPSHAAMSVAEIIEALSKFKARHVVITGGEPCDYDLTDLTKAIMQMNRSVQIETSGTSEVRVAHYAWVTVSPKVGMPGGWQLLDQALARADEIKMPVGKPADIENLRAVLAQTAKAKSWMENINGGPQHVWLQPLSQSEKATDLCIAAATENGWKLSAQLHKYLHVR